MFNKRILTPLLIILLLFGFVVMGAPTYVNVGPTTYFEGDVGIPGDCNYYKGGEIFEGGGATQLSDLSDVGVSTPTDTYVLVADGDSWESRALIEADISNLGAYLEDISGESIGDLGDVDLTGIANGKILKYNSTSENWECEDESGGGYTNLTSFVDQTAWRLFYSNTGGDIVELPLGADGTYFKSNGETSAPTFDIPAGGGDVLGPATSVDNSIARFNGTDNKTIQDSLAIVDDSGSINIPTGQSYKINNVAVVAVEVDPTVDSDAELKAILVDEVTKTGDFTAGRIVKVNNNTGIIEQSDIEKKASGGYDVNANSIGFTEQVLASGAAIAWDLRISNKATLTAAHDFTITIIAPTEALNAQLIITQDGTGTRVMDEIVTQSDATIIEAEVHIDTEIIDLTIDIPTGARIRFKTSGVIPTPLVADTIYWAIRTSENHIQVATTKALAIAGTAVNLSDDGTDTQTVQQLVKWMGGTLGVLSTAVGSEDILSLTYKTADKQWYAVLNNDFY